MKKIGLLLLLLVPSLSFAALKGFYDLIYDIGGLVDLIWYLMFSIAILFFFWGVAQFILNDAGNDKTRDEGKKKILWGIIALFVMFSIYGILNFAGDLVGINPNDTLSAPPRP